MRGQLTLPEHAQWCAIGELVMEQTNENPLDIITSDAEEALEYCSLNEYEDFLKKCQHWLLEKELPNDDGDFDS